jgi:O-antigen/teichoic acid export membrane protein
LWVYQFSVIGFLFSFITTPYVLLIIAHENMNIYAYASIAEVLLKLGIVFLLTVIPFDKLKIYGILICFTSCINSAIYLLTCRVKYAECKFKFYWDKNLFKELLSYTAWHLFGTAAEVSKNQVITIIINQFFNPVVIAARSISVSVSGVIANFAGHFNTAINPQIIKRYAAKQNTEFLSLIFSAAKGAYFLIYIVSLPLILETQTVLTLWLKNPPEYTIIFTRLALFDMLAGALSYPIMTAAQASGKVKLNQAVTGVILLLNVPAAWIILYLGAPPYSVIISSICITFITFAARLLILPKLIPFFSVTHFLQKAIIPVFFVSLFSAIVPFLLFIFIKQNLFRLCLVTGTAIVFTCFFIFILGLNKEERKSIYDIAKEILKIKP